MKIALVVTILAVAGNAGITTGLAQGAETSIFMSSKGHDFFSYSSDSFSNDLIPKSTESLREKANPHTSFPDRPFALYNNSFIELEENKHINAFLISGKSMINKVLQGGIYERHYSFFYSYLLDKFVISFLSTVVLII